MKYALPLLLLALAGPIQASAEGLLAPMDETFVAMGKVIYDSECAACHGAQLEGQANWRERLPDGKLPAPPHDETGHTWHHPDRQLFNITKLGLAPFAGPDYPTDMPAFGSRLTDAEIIAVLSYIKSTWPENIQKQHDLRNGS
ncbi:c-type cytochrome [Pacificispira spongiicola]|nr:cytochrome c [Pacificispira spongiicola]